MIPATVLMKNPDGEIAHWEAPRRITAKLGLLPGRVPENSQEFTPPAQGFSFQKGLLHPLRFCGRRWEAISRPMKEGFCHTICEVVKRFFMGLFLIVAMPFAGTLGLLGAAMKPTPLSYTVSLMGGAMRMCNGLGRLAPTAYEEVKYLGPTVTNQGVAEAVVDEVGAYGLRNEVHSVTVSSLVPSTIGALNLNRCVVIRSSEMHSTWNVFVNAFNNRENPLDEGYHRDGEHGRVHMLQLAQWRWGGGDVDAALVLKQSLKAYGAIQFDVPHDLSSVTVTVGA